jgi:hypothetical protein
MIEELQLADADASTVPFLDGERTPAGLEARLARSDSHLLQLHFPGMTDERFVARQILFGGLSLIHATLGLRLTSGRFLRTCSYRD